MKQRECQKGKEKNKRKEKGFFFLRNWVRCCPPPTLLFVIFLLMLTNVLFWFWFLFFSCLLLPSCSFFSFRVNDGSLHSSSLSSSFFFSRFIYIQKQWHNKYPTSWLISGCLPCLVHTPFFFIKIYFVLVTWLILPVAYACLKD